MKHLTKGKKMQQPFDCTRIRTGAAGFGSKDTNHYTKDII